MKKIIIRDFDPGVRQLKLDFGYQKCWGVDYDDETQPICFNPNRVELYEHDVKERFLGGYKVHRPHDYMWWFHELNVEYSPRDGTVCFYTDVGANLGSSFTIGSQDPGALRQLAEFLLEVADHEEHNFEQREPLDCWGSPSGATVRKTSPTEYIHFYPKTVVTNDIKKRKPHQERS